MNKLTKVLAIVLMALAVVLATLAWWLGRQPEKNVTEIARGHTPAYMTVVASEFLPRGQKIEERHLKVIETQRPIPSAFQSIASVVGRIPMIDLEADTLISDSILVQGLAVQLQDGERAIAVPVDEVNGAGNQISAGDFVDVFMTLRQGTDIEKGQSRLIASRMRVLAYGSDVLGAVIHTASSVQGNAPVANNAARSAVLAAPMADVNPLLLAAQNGKLTLALRAPGDLSTIDKELFPTPALALAPKAKLDPVEQVRLQNADNQAYAGIELLNWSGGKAQGTTSNTNSTPVRQGATAITAPRAAGRTVEVIKGTQREQARF